jgi:ATP-binding cassette subfamily F protein uup
LKQFLFDAKKQYNYVGSLSGGEKRRLYLLTILMQQPNFLVLDEPTNDLDIDTLNVLEDFLAAYNGCILIVTHDRYFMDNLVDSLFVFEGNGKIRSFNGNYQEYLNDLESNSKTPTAVAIMSEPVQVQTSKKKLSYKEQRELEQLTEEIAILEQQKIVLEQKLQENIADHETLLTITNDYETVKQKLDSKELRWLELTE